MHLKHLITKFLKSIYRFLAPLDSKRYQLSYKLIQKILINFRPLNINYRKLLQRTEAIDEQRFEDIHNAIEVMSSPPLFSIVMPVFNPSLQFLAIAIESVQAQCYPHWELCISDDASTVTGVRELIRDYAENDERIRYIFREKNGHISASSNSALELAVGDYMVLLDHDDQLHPMALYEAAQVIKAYPDCEIIYSDEDKITERGKHYNPYFKPDFDYELLLSHNMVSHLGIYKLETVKSVGGFRLGLEGSQDYDLLLRVIEQVNSDQVHHIPRVLYHWRSSSHSVAENINIKPYAVLAGERALNEHLARRGKLGEITFMVDSMAYQVSYEIPEPHPKVQIIWLPTSNSNNLKTIQTLLVQTDYDPLQITIGLFEEETQYPLDSVKNSPRISFAKINSSEGIPKSLNEIVSSLQVDLICLLTGDIVEISFGWLSTLVAQAIQDGVGAVGPKVLANNGLVYSNGMIFGGEDIISPFFEGELADYAGYFGWGQVRRGFSALSGECLVVKTADYLSVGGLSEQLQLRNNIWADFCLKLKTHGLRNVICPSVNLRIAKPKRDTELNNRDDGERKYMLDKWGNWIDSDPAFNPNLSLKNGDIRINDHQRSFG